MEFWACNWKTDIISWTRMSKGEVLLFRHFKDFMAQIKFKFFLYSTFIIYNKKNFLPLYTLQLKSSLAITNNVYILIYIILNTCSVSYLKRHDLKIGYSWSLSFPVILTRDWLLCGQSLSTRIWCHSISKYLT